MFFPIIPRALLVSQYQGYRGLCQQNISILKLFFSGYGNRTPDCRHSQQELWPWGEALRASVCPHQEECWGIMSEPRNPLVNLKTPALLLGHQEPR